MSGVSLRSHYRLSDLVLASSTAELESHVTRGTADRPEWVEVRQHQMKSLEAAESSLAFHRLAMSVQMESALSSHETDPFVHVFTSLPDQGVGSLDLLHARRDILQEVVHSKSNASKLRAEEAALVRRIDEIEARDSVEDGTIQVQMGEFFLDKAYGANVTEAQEFGLSVPSIAADAWADDVFPADTTIHFQVHSRIKNSEGHASHELTGTGFLHLSKLVKEVADHGEEDDMVPVQIPLKLNCVSSQSPDAKMVYSVAKAHDLDEENEQLYQGSLFVYVDLRDEDTQRFFGQGVRFARPSRDDVTPGNFAHVATSMRMHIMRDMSPFIAQFTEGIPISLEEERPRGGIGDRATRVVTGWKFEPSLPEGRGIHAPYNKGNTHTLPGFTYFSDRAMQRLPNTEFILHVSRTVLARWNMSEAEYQRVVENPLVEGRLRPEYVDALAVTSEILTAYPTAMNYRGDYADMNTTVLRHLHSLGHRSIHHLEHGTGMTRVSAGKRWDIHKKIGTEMFGDAVIDKSGDCEDFAKLIDRMVVGIQTCKSTHPLVASVQAVLREYQPYSVLSSVTSRNIREAPSTSKGRPAKDEIHVGVEVGSPEDLKAGIGAHMWTILLPKSMVARAMSATHGAAVRSVDSSTLQRKLPPLVLEGTGPALSLLLAKESYHESMHDKIGAINTDLARMEALARMMTGLTTEQITYQSMRDGNKLFAPFTLPIRTNRVVDANINERPSPFYRMAVEMFAVEKSERVVPPALARLHHQTRPFDAGHREAGAYSGARSIPVLLRPRTEGEPVDPIGYRYGVNVTDLVHRREDLFGLLETVRSSEDEQRTIDNVMRHAPSSPVIRLSPKAEMDAAKAAAARVERMLNSADLQRTLSRGFMGRPQDLHEVHMYIRQEDVDEAHLRKLAEHFADNGFVGQEPIRVVAESFSRGHHLLRITVPVDVTGVKQLFFESDALAEHLDKPANRQKEFLVAELKKLVE